MAGVVTTMIRVFGAPIAEADGKIIVEYLTSTYGAAEVARAGPRAPEGKPLDPWELAALVARLVVR